MKEQQRLDKVLIAAYDNVQSEVCALTGAEFSLSEPQFTLSSKEDAFDQLTSKQVLSKIDIVGDIEGEGCLLFGIKDAIRLGGILIMLPDSELDSVVADEKYTEDIEDSFGEIANIIVGGYSKSFEDIYPKACRCIRKEQEVITPAKIDIASDQPVTDQFYYVVTHQVTINGAASGNMVLLLPAATFSLSVEGLSQDEAVLDNEADEQATEESPDANRTEDDAETEEPSLVVPYNPKNLERIDKIIDAASERVAEEVTGLIGGEVVLGQLSKDFKTKEELLEGLSGKQIAARMDVRGDIAGQGALFVSLKGAIRVGGTLIMLPQTELEEAIKQEEYNEETEDSYGEVANIIAGSYSKVFEESYPKNCRIIRKEQECILPVKIDSDSDDLIPYQTYYVVAGDLSVNGTSCGQLVMALPAITFGILPPDTQPESASTEKQSSSDDKSGSVAETAEPSTSAGPVFDSEKQKNKIDGLFEQCRERMQEEVGALLSTEVSFKALENKLVTKEDFFFNEALGKQVLAHMDVAGDEEDKAFLYAGLKDAIRSGGTLIMLPQTELDTAIAEEDYSEDIQDAYAEIANIIAGVYTGIFEEQYTKKLRFIRKELEKIVPMKVDIGSNEPMPDQKYYLHSLQFFLGEQELGHFHLAVPATVFQLDKLGEKADVNAGASSSDSVKKDVISKAATEEPVVNKLSDEASGSHDVIVIGNDQTEKDKITKVLEAKGLRVKDLQLKDNVFNYVNDNIKVVFLVMEDVNEIGFGVSIKISSACSCPLIAAGTAWTRTKVIKAVKYGISDILLTPATDADIHEKLDSNAVKLAA